MTIYSENTRIYIEEGFHLLEITITMALFAALLSTSLLSLRSSVTRLTLRSEVELLTFQLKHYALQSILVEETFLVSLFKERYEVSTVRDPKKIIYAHNIKKPVELDLPEHKELSFFPSGATTPATLRLLSSNASCTLILSLRGRARHSCS